MAALQRTNAGFEPHLCIIQVGAQDASSTYIRMKRQAAEQCGIRSTHVQLDAATSEADICHVVQRLNADPKVDGVLVQLPLGDHIDADGERRVTEEVSAAKDVDGFHAHNIGMLASRACNPHFVRARPRVSCGCLPRSA